MANVLLDSNHCRIITTNKGSNILLFKNLNKVTRKDAGIIYCLVDPRNNEIKYIGKCLTGHKRPFDHIRDGNLKNEPNLRKKYWLKELKSLNLKPDYYFIDYLILQDKKQRNKILYSMEHKYINLLKNECDLLNLSDWGCNIIGRELSLETRKKMSESAKKRGSKNLESFKIKKLAENKFINEIEYRLCSNCSNWLTLNNFSFTKNINYYNRCCSKCKWKKEKNKKCQKL